MEFAMYVTALGFALFAMLTAVVWKSATIVDGFAAFICGTVTITCLALCVLFAFIGHSAR
jgi:hypothetical protein